MAIPRYLAMTGEELLRTPAPKTAIAWMACHFSPYSTGLSNLPKELPAHSLLILNDRIPYHFHDPEQIAQQLSNVFHRCQCSGLLLDFQRPFSPSVSHLVQRISGLSCPVAVTSAYAEDTGCPVFLPPCPAHRPLADHLSAWQGREIWLDLSPGWETATVTKDGARFAASAPAPTPFRDIPLCCHYGISLTEDGAVFTLFRDPQDLTDLLDKAEGLGVTLAVGLYQELSGAEKTALENPGRS